MQLKHTIVMLTAAGMLSAQAYPSEMPAEAAVLPAQSLAAFTDADMAALFDNANQLMQLAALSGQEMLEAEGGWHLGTLAVSWAALGRAQIMRGAQTVATTLGILPDFLATSAPGLLLARVSALLVT